MEKINPIVLEDPESGKKYTLEFSRESVKNAEARGFNISELTTFPNTNIPLLFFYAFRKNHPNVAKNQTDKMIEDLGGLMPEEITRLVELYNQPSKALVIQEGESRKNSRLTMTL